jgi:peroxiredoxin
LIIFSSTMALRAPRGAGDRTMSMEETFARIAASGFPLQGKLDEFKNEFETKFAPPAALEVMHRVTEKLIESGQALGALKAGEQAPDFSLPDSEGRLVSSRELLSGGPIVLTFYRGFWCPYCNFDLAALEAARGEIEKRGATLVAVSQQTAANSRKSQRANKVGFPILVDKGGALAEKFGIRWDVPKDLKQIHKQVGADLEVFNGDGSWTLPMPARYVVGSDGLIAYSEVNPDYTRRPEPSDIFPVLDALLADRAA